MPAVSLIKAHAYGNDFLCVPAGESGAQLSVLAASVCERHRGVGGDGLVLYEMRPLGATMMLFNADGSASELSGNGLRCLAAVIARAQGVAAGTTITIDTAAGIKTLTLLEREGERYSFRAAMGQPARLRQEVIPVLGEQVTASVLEVGNPQCVVLGPLPTAERFNRLGPALATHPMFPAGTNVEFAEIEAPDRVRIVIWERGVGPTHSSGTGSSASAVAASAHGGASRSIDVVAPGGTQRVDWLEEGIFLTGWAEIVLEGRWLANVP